jgi:hypothetical protein
VKLNSIQIKIISLIIILLVITIVTVTTISLDRQRADLLSAAENTLYMNMDILKATINNIMIAGEAPIAVETMRDYKEIPDFKEIDVYRVDGNVAFRDYGTLDFVNDYQDMIRFSKTPRVPQKMKDNTVFKKVITSGKEDIMILERSREMEFFFPIPNKSDCWDCHGNQLESGTLRGIAHIKISIGGIYNQISRARNIFILLFALAGVVLAVVLIMTIRQLIVKPILTIGKTVTTFWKRRPYAVAHAEEQG